MQLKNATLKETKMRNGENAKKMITPETNWTNMISEKLQKARKKQKKCKSDQGPTRQT